MDKNYMAKIAEMFGMKLGEPFIIRDTCKDTEYRYEFRETGLCCLEHDLPIDKVFKLNVCVLRDLIIGVGNIEIIKCSKKPKTGEVYYLPKITKDGNPGYYYGTWFDTLADEAKYDMGVVCRTEKEALELGNAILEFWRQHND